MAEFICRLGTPSGEIITKSFEADKIEELKQKLEQEGYKIFSISDRRGSIGKIVPLEKIKKPRIKQKDFLLFNQQFSALLKAGIPVLQAINLLRRRSPSATLRQILANIEEKIKSGASLSSAFETEGIFPKIYTASLLAGERSGALDETLKRYVSYLKRSVNVARKVRSAIAYPIFLIIASIAMISFLVLYVVPRMSQLFKGLSTNRELPMITVVVLTVSTTIAKNLIWLLPLGLILGFVFYLWIKTEKGRLFFDSLILKLPLIGNLIRQITTAQFTRSMATLLAGGITIPDSWEIAAASITNTELRRRSEQVLPMIREGKSFSEALEQTGWIPELALDMISIGERSGSLKEMLDEVANFYDAESEVRLEQITTLLEPVILVLMAIVVASILLAVYMPIIQAISSGPFAGRR
ncbi:MAG: type II secretion system F family protein [Pyrinomonadaceae bacterium]|nr:type II secretion system F family protein [Pyrinomonadaceae bacterium]MCX7639416.1 type II secretion system F family protein [Pyrinomonadaceae bacterium]MDW8304534.1 type II secretion system F family protein [Acidobacteriota bacterium]